jgi:hypothetical protein
MTINRKRADRMASDQAMIEGIQTFFAQNATLTVGSITMAPGDLVKVFQERIASSKAVITASAAKDAAVKDDRVERAKTAPTVNTFRRLVLATFEGSPDTLAVFGLKDRKVPTTDVATKAQAKAKSEATRKARHTMGSRQRRKVTGDSPAPGTTSAPEPPPATSPAKPTA